MARSNYRAAEATHHADEHRKLMEKVVLCAPSASCIPCSPSLLSLTHCRPVARPRVEDTCQRRSLFRE